MYPSGPPSLAHEAPPQAWPVGAPAPVAARRQILTRHRFAALVALAGGVLAAIGSLMTWAEYADGFRLKGIDHGNGWVSLGFALGAACLAGAVWFGARHVAVRTAFGLAAAGLLGVFFWNRFRVHQADGRSKIGDILIGTGLQLVGVAAFLVTLAAAVVIVPELRRRRSD